MLQATGSADQPQRNTLARVRLASAFQRIEPAGMFRQDFGVCQVMRPGMARLAKAVGGSLGVASRVGQGSTFWVELPPARGQSDPLPSIEIEDLSAVENFL